MSLRGFIQLLVLIVGMLFEMIRTGQGQIEPFIVSNWLEMEHKEWFRSLVYNVCEHLKFITISVMMWMGPEPGSYKLDRLFVMLAAADFLDYVLWGNNLWWSFTIIPHETGFGFILPLSMNVLSVLIFACGMVKYGK